MKALNSLKSMYFLFGYDLFILLFFLVITLNDYFCRRVACDIPFVFVQQVHSIIYYI